MPRSMVRNIPEEQNCIFRGSKAYQCSGAGEEIRDEGEHIICEDPEAGHVYSERTEKYL